MKRLLSLLVVIAMVVSMIPNVFATKEEVDFDELTGRLVVLEDIATEIEVALAEGSDGMVYQWTPFANVNLTLTWTAPEGADIDVVITQGETSVEAESGVAVPVYADQVVEVEVSEAAAQAAEFVITGEYGFVEGTEDAPIMLQSNVNEVVAEGTVFTGDTTWYQARHNGPVIIEGTGAFNVIYNGETFAAVDGEVEIEVTASMFAPAVFAIDTVGAYTISLIIPVGAQENPAELIIGENTVEFAEGAGEYFYNWTAEEEGKLVITMPEGNWQYTLSNMTTGVYGEIQWSDSDPVANPAVLDVAAGDVIELKVLSYDPANPWTAPAGSITFTADFELPEPPAPTLVITAQPESVTVDEGAKAIFTVAAEGEGLTYQWYYKNAADTSFKASGAATAKTASFEAAAAASSGHHGREYYCVITDANGNSVQSETVSLSVKFFSEMTDKTKKWPANSVATLKAVWSRDGEPGVTYRWYYSNDNGASWHTTGMTGYDTNTLSVKTDVPTRSGYRYKCLITDNGVEYWSDYTIMYITTDPAVVTKQPVNATVRAGYSATFSVEAEGFGLSYQWKWSNDGINWSNSTGTGYATNTLTVKSNNYNGGRYYKCTVYTIDGSGWQETDSEIAQMTVTPAVEIVEQPTSVTVKAGETAVFHVGLAEGETEAVPVTYQWQWGKWAGNWMNTSKPGATTDTVSITDVTVEMNGRYYICLMYNGTVAGWVYSDPVQLFVEP